ncbi:uncharacterized protein FIBRA_04705 [Fibroporia radiculosa]|uniref:Uncharacterized protein n=1 Tax=Fibroporia radiculosa TaxID=599839 RepID=J4HWP1_9APHY|nr:uncharacterized protein FIBRA_04705 [Fibroporia radiculosa]CCM02602.1 predicted protein [Fibroporia radiculosa]
MPFSFSFTLTVPGITNPFSTLCEPTPSLGQGNNGFPDAEGDKNGSKAQLYRRPPSPSLLPPRSRKRGWVPANSEISQAAAIPTSTSGYLDTPAKYREMASNGDELEEMATDLPPPKRRRTLAGSIVSTALSAALIGTAVGLTVYRLWRDRSKQPEPLPPPPYEQGEWVPPKPDSPSIPVTQVTPPTPRSRKSRHVAGRRTQARHRKALSRAGPSSISYGSSSVSASRAPIPPEFNFGAPLPVDTAEDADGDDQISWMGDRLASLIAEGQRALGKEVVVMSESQEDEVDDGADGWEEEDAGHSHASTSRMVGNSGLPPYSRHGSPLPSASPRRSTFDLNRSYRGSSVPSTPCHLRRDASVERNAFASASFHEDESQWQTPELREAMALARQRYMHSRT